MTDDELDAMAGLVNDGVVGTHWDGCHRLHPRCAVAALVGEVRRLRAAVAAERERCAGVAEATEVEGCYRLVEDGVGVWDSDAEATKAEIARRIRRGPEPTEGE